MGKKWWVVAIVAIALAAIVAVISLKPNADESVESKKSKKQDLVPYFQEIESDQEMHEKGFDIQDFYAWSNDEGVTVKESYTNEILKLEESYGIIKKHADKAILKELEKYTETVQDLLIQQNELDHKLRYVEVSVENPKDMYLNIIDTFEIDNKAEEAVLNFLTATEIEFTNFQNIIDKQYAPSKEEFIDIYIPHLIFKYVKDYKYIFDELADGKLEYLEEEAYQFDFNIERDESKLTDNLVYMLKDESTFETVYNEWEIEYYYDKIPEASYDIPRLKEFYELLMDGKSAEEVFPWGTKQDSEATGTLSEQEAETYVSDTEDYLSKISNLVIEGSLNENIIGSSYWYYDDSGNLRYIIDHVEDATYELLLRDDKIVYIFKAYYENGISHEGHYYMKDENLVRFVTYYEGNYITDNSFSAEENHQLQLEANEIINTYESLISSF